MESPNRSIGLPLSLRASLLTRKMTQAPAFLMGLLRSTTLNVLLQYIAIRFDWKLSQAVVLVSEVAAVNLLLFLLVVPHSLTHIRKYYQTPPRAIDLGVFRISISLLGFGALLIGLVPNIATLIPGNLYLPILS